MSMGRKPLETEQLRNRRVATYVTASEDAAILELSASHGYQGTADVMRKALACLILTKFPELKKNLRSDLKDLTDTIVPD
jgi:hypothetical protein